MPIQQSTRDRRELDRSYISINDVAGTVILYNSEICVLENIHSYLDQVSILYVIDNSNQVNYGLVDILREVPKVEYISNRTNLGIASALNKAAQKAIEAGFLYLLTMDDDSKAPTEMVLSMISFINRYKNPAAIGIVSVAHRIYKNPDPTDFQKVDFTMTSGNLINLAAYKSVSGFKDELFIDHVDHEYALRLQLHRYEIVELCSIKLDHRLGTLKSLHIFGFKIAFISHSPKRFYYLIRNSIFIIRTYIMKSPLFCLKIMWPTLKEFGKSMLLEEQKHLRINYFFQAVRAGWIGQLGEFNN